MVADNIRRRKWQQNPDAVKNNILETATAIFAKDGFSGARMDDIARQTETSKRMVYYYFTDKKQLYITVLEAAYAKVRAAENELNLEGYPAGEALIRLIGFTFDYHRNHPDFVRLIQIENIHQARHLSTSDIISAVNLSAIAALERLIKRGSEAGEFHSNNDALELHWLITSSCVFNITNRASFQQLYGANLFTDDGQDRLKKLIISSIMQTVLA